MLQLTEEQASALGEPRANRLPIRPSVSLDDKQTTRQTLIGYASSVIASTILFDAKDGIQATKDARPEWEGLDTTGDGHLAERIAGLLDGYDTDTIRLLVEGSMASAISILANKKDSGINLIVGKVALHALSNPESETGK